MRRPRLVLTGAIAHGYATMFFIADETLSHGAAAFCDVLERVIEHVWAACRRSGVSLPLHLVFQTDNTVAQAKNSLTNVFFAYLVAKCKFQTTSLFYLVVGHTHEDIDQLFGVVLGLALQRIKWQTKHDLAAALVANLRDRVAARGEELIVQTLGVVRDFQSWLQPLGVELYNAFATRAGIESPHSFTFKMRKDLVLSEGSMLPPRHADGDVGDVFCCVKTYMHSPSRFGCSGVPVSAGTNSTESDGIAADRAASCRPGR